MTLYFDFETSYIVGGGWQMYNKGPAFYHVFKDVEIISVAYCVDDGPIYCVGVDDFKGHKAGWYNLNDRKLVEFFVPKIEEADYVVAQNGKGFDFKVWRTRLAVHNLAPHHEPKELDTKSWAKSKFRFTDNRQDTITRQLGLTTKRDHEKKLHVKCIEENDPRAWKEMKLYNKQDVQGLREMAKRMAPFVTNTPNANVLRGTSMGCPNPLCPDPARGMNRRGPRQKSNMSLVQSYQCKACGKYATGPIIQAGVILR